jgi:chemosensory pili system protein ChpA (sensor histidine kinase/response regulator)
MQARIKAARLGFQRGFLKWLKHDSSGAAAMRDAVAMIEMAESQPAARSFWWVAMAFFDALAVAGVDADINVKKLCGRIEAQMRKLLAGSGKVADRMMREMLYYVARAPHSTEHLECVRAAYRLDGLIPQIGETLDIAPLKPVLRTSRDFVASAKEQWNRYCAGTTAALAQFREIAGQLAGSIGALEQPEITRLATAILKTADALQAKSGRHNDAASLEVATALLLLDGALENFPEIGHEFAYQVSTVVGRLAALLRGEELSTLALPQLDEISRKAQERLLMHQVAKEILASLAVVEQALDAFFRDPELRSDLPQLSRPLSQIAGALTVLGQDRAVEVLRECEARIAAFHDEKYTPEPLLSKTGYDVGSSAGVR